MLHTHARFGEALTAFAHHEHVEVIHRSLELDPGRGAAQIEPVSTFLRRRFGPQGPAMDDQVAIQARRDGLPYRTDRQLGSTLDAHRLLQLAKDEGRQLALLALLFETNFAKAESIFTGGALLDLASRVGLALERARRTIKDPSLYLAAVRDDERTAANLGASGVPISFIDGRRALSGAKSVIAFRDVLDNAWADHAENASGSDPAVCRPDGACAIPERNW